MGKKRKLRGVLTGGLPDIERAFEILTQGLKADNAAWSLEMEETKSFGDKGPLHKKNFGFILEE